MVFAAKCSVQLAYEEGHHLCAQSRLEHLASQTPHPRRLRHCLGLRTGRLADRIDVPHVDLEDKNQSREKLELELSVKSETRTAILAMGRVHALEAMNDAGRSLLLDPELPAPPNGDIFIPLARAQLAKQTILLQSPPSAAARFSNSRSFCRSRSWSGAGTC